MTKTVTEQILTAIESRDSIIILMPNSIAEALLLGSLAWAISDTHDAPVVLGFAPHHAALVASLYPERCKQIIAIRQSAIKVVGREVQGRPLTKGFPYVMDLSLPDDPLMMATILATKRRGFGVALTDALRLKLQLPIDTPLELPSLGFIKNPALDVHGLVESGEDYGLIFVANNTNYPLKMQFLLEIKDQLIQQGISRIYYIDSGGMIKDPEFDPNFCEKINLNPLQAVYYILHSKFTVSATNGMTSAVMLAASSEEYSGDMQYHSVQTDYVCRDYRKLTTDFENAFSYYGHASLNYVHPELVYSCHSVKTWFLGRESSVLEGKELAVKMFSQSIDYEESDDDRFAEVKPEQFPKPLQWRG